MNVAKKFLSHTIGSTQLEKVSETRWLTRVLMGKDATPLRTVSDPDPDTSWPDAVAVTVPAKEVL